MCGATGAGEPLPRGRRGARWRLGRVSKPTLGLAQPYSCRIRPFTHAPVPQPFLTRDFSPPAAIAAPTRKERAKTSELMGNRVAGKSPDGSELPQG